MNIDKFLEENKMIPNEHGQYIYTDKKGDCLNIALLLKAFASSLHTGGQKEPIYTKRDSIYGYRVADYFIYADGDGQLHWDVASSPDQGKEQEWISVHDELPKKSQPCLVFAKGYGIVVRQWNWDYNCWDCEDGDDYWTNATDGRVTHWQPLPPAPKDEKGGKNGTE